jgi:4-hydroxy-3-polyprenylbenzoate decarboxylase
LNAGSKVVMAASGPARRKLSTMVPGELQLVDGFSEPRLCSPGVLAIQAENSSRSIEALIGVLEPQAQLFGLTGSEGSQFDTSYSGPNPSLRSELPLIVVVDDSEMAARSLNNWLWMVFTRSDPAMDVYGLFAATQHKHWGCRSSLVIDARRKPHHAPPLVESAEVTKRVDAMAARGGPIARYL